MPMWILAVDGKYYVNPSYIGYLPNDPDYWDPFVKEAYQYQEYWAFLYFGKPWCGVMKG